VAARKRREERELRRWMGHRDWCDQNL
jgi:hypothetical protein